jgi:anaerobic selenocysteine-containing dehydrogenase
MQMQRSGERGSANLKFVIVMALLGSAAYTGYLYIPVAFQANAYKDLMQHYADVTVTQGYAPSWAGQQLVKSAGEYGVPANAIITPANRDNRVEVRVQFIKEIEFPGYTYNYEFDHTVKSTAFLAFK